MQHDYWEPDDPLVDRQPPDEEEFGLDTTEQVDEGWTDAEPGADAGDWLADVEPDATDSGDGFTAAVDPTETPIPAAAPIPTEVDEPPVVPARSKAVLIAASALGAAAILIAVLRRRG
ncbi:hypothetical protein [Microlunatus speluncae]|uniref:hypothetical protein n=1 Tax=Microlunatus speluncae TaxID=2594267 RepID=UPI0012661593|nr:hypothetical protein [Microlunatus speluncae]